ncbi:hypothetical protein POTOM_030091 [Populus tomentosa]|uniref:NADH dehydrogenase [ubiquinone] 1 beta subcomplex subunit 7 n=1 Tax=Populus tomentosa TaxID=118781 RepID=A0A8X8CK81_POPTO|nr:hypothetical protein POTOM_030091 [Populus tomentosa]
MELPGSSKPMIATQEEMVEARVPIPYRDQCAHLLIPLNKCRHAEFFLPWKCENERHIYEKCEYELVMERMLQMQKIREAEAKLKQSHKQGTIPLIPKTANAYYSMYLIVCEAANVASAKLRFIFEIDLDIAALAIIINKVGLVTLNVSYKSIFWDMLLVTLDILGAHAVERYLLLNSYSCISVLVSGSYFTVHVLSMIPMTGSFEITRNGSFDFLAAFGGKLFHWELFV